MRADAAGELPEGVIKDAYNFLQQQGCINMGVPTEDKEPEEALEAFPTDDDIIQGLQESLEHADLEVRCPVDSIMEVIHLLHTFCPEDKASCSRSSISVLHPDLSCVPLR